jgi:hypothetical protein
MIQILFGYLGFFHPKTMDFYHLPSGSNGSGFSLTLQLISLEDSNILTRTLLAINGQNRLCLFSDSTVYFFHQILECFCFKVMDLAPPVPLDDGWSLITSGLQDFIKSTLLYTQRVNARALYLDPMIVGPSHSDPTDGIYSFLIRASAIWMWDSMT